MATLKEETEIELKRVIDDFIKGVKRKGVSIKLNDNGSVPTSLKAMVIAHLDSIENHKLFWRAKSLFANKLDLIIEQQISNSWGVI